MTNLITARSPAAFAEEYILDSIWNGKFAAGTILPAERELSEQIGVTRTTLREVLQRLARDGWLDIQHGKPTKVNNIWDKAGLHVLSTILQLDKKQSVKLAEQILQVRAVFNQNCLCHAVKNNLPEMVNLLTMVERLEDKSQAYVEFDFLLHKKIAELSNNSVYRLVFNGFESSYDAIGTIYFTNRESRSLAKDYYNNLKLLAEKQSFNEIERLAERYHQQSLVLWEKLACDMRTIYQENDNPN